MYEYIYVYMYIYIYIYIYMCVHTHMPISSVVIRNLKNSLKNQYFVFCKIQVTLQNDK